MTTVGATRELVVEARGGILRITLNRPNKRNALSRSVVEQLHSVLTDTAADQLVRVVVLAAVGPVFCAGHDLSEMVGCSETEYCELFSKCTSVMQELRKMPQVIIARVQGLATAAGCQLVAACDLAVAATNASFATPGVKIGLFCTTPMVPLVRSIPAKPALEMLLTGEPISAERAWQLGLVNRVVPQDELDRAVDHFANAILSTSPAVIRLGKTAFYDQLTLDETEAYRRANQVITRNAIHPDAQEGIAAFLERRPPLWLKE